jgi:hypothetical protein
VLLTGARRARGHLPGLSRRRTDPARGSGVADNLPEIVAVRDTKDRDGGTLILTHSAWTAFLTGAEAGEFDLPA